MKPDAPTIPNWISCSQFAGLRMPCQLTKLDECALDVGDGRLEHRRERRIAVRVGKGSRQAQVI